MNYHSIKKYDVANGKGIRVSLFCSGCSHHCKDCFNSETWDPDSGKPYTKETQIEILKACEPDYISGLSLLGGEPMEEYNQVELVNLAQKFKEKFPNKDIWCWSGYLFEELKDNNSELLPLIDYLIDGEFKVEEKDLRLKWMGSTNQRLIDVQKSLKNNNIEILN